MRRDSGFTLVEVLVATTMVAVAVGGLGYMWSAAAGVNRSAKRSTYAALLAAEKMEELRALPLDDPALAASPPEALRTDAEGYYDAPLEGYRRRWLVAPLPSYPLDARVLHVLVWSAGDPGEASLVTIKTRKVE
jgi:prepilin-type N-terminal cleavage/methylation domain-containing protein